MAKSTARPETSNARLKPLNLTREASITSFFLTPRLNEMPLFSLPLDPSSTRPSTRVHFHPSISRKRKRPSPHPVDSADEHGLPTSPPPTEYSSLPAASTNPLSLDPDEIHQYRVAGLDLDQELPSKSIPGFPHRGLPPSFPSTSHTDETPEANSDGPEVDNADLPREKRAPNLRMQHLSVLTSILQRCLLEGDIPRARRAWAMLLRAQHNGKGVDIRSSGYWGIGAELLIRDGEEPARGRTAFGHDGSVSSQSGSNSDEDGEPGESKRYQNAERRWGTASGLEKAKDYYERLILQHPYTRQYHDSVNSLDFWPAMLSCEIYGIQFEQKEALKRVADEEQSDDILIVDSSSGEDEDPTTNDPDAYFAAQQRREARHGARKQDAIWTKRHHIRQTALLASEKVAARMDELIMTPPYSDSHALQRLRGMLALYIGDLSVPDLFEADSDPEDDDDSHDDDYGDRRGDRRGDVRDVAAAAAAYGQRAAQRALRRQRRIEHERGLMKRTEARLRARKALERVPKKDGWIDVDVAGPVRADFHRAEMENVNMNTF